MKNPGGIIITMVAIALLIAADIASSMTTQVSASVIKSNVTQRIDTGCAWDGITDGIEVMGYYQSMMSASTYDLNELMPSVIPAMDYFLLVFSSEDLVHNGLNLSYIVVTYGEKSC